MPMPRPPRAVVRHVSHPLAAPVPCLRVRCGIPPGRIMNTLRCMLDSLAPPGFGPTAPRPRDWLFLILVTCQ